MTQEEVKMRAELYSALAEGKTIQVKNPNGTWEDVKIEGLNKIYDYNNYRIKPESKYRPFESAKECIEEMRKHEPFGWVKDKPDVGDYCSPIIDIRCYGSAFNFIKLRGSWMNTNIMFKNYTFLDGSPFGVKVEDKEE